MPLTLFIGGPLDGQLKEVKPTSDRYIAFGDSMSTTTVYFIANGIARHESLSEEECAALIHGRIHDQAFHAQLPKVKISDILGERN